MKFNIKYAFTLLALCLALLTFVSADFNDSILDIPKIDANFFLKNELEDGKNPVTKKFKLQKMDDLPAFLEHTTLNEKDGLCLLSKFLISQDSWIKSIGGVFDQTNFDGLPDHEPISKEKSLEWHAQRARSAAKLWFDRDKTTYEAYGAQPQKSSMRRWLNFNVLLVGQTSVQDHVMLRVCLPENKCLLPIVVRNNEDCTSKIKSVEQTALKNKAYLLKMKKTHFFKQSTKPSSDNNTSGNVVNSQGLNSKLNQVFMPNPPQMNNKGDLRGNGQAQAPFQVPSMYVPNMPLPNIPNEANNTNNMNMSNININMNNKGTNSGQQQSQFVNMNAVSNGENQALINKQQLMNQLNQLNQLNMLRDQQLKYQQKLIEQNSNNFKFLQKNTNIVSPTLKENHLNSINQEREKLEKNSKSQNNEQQHLINSNPPIQTQEQQDPIRKLSATYDKKITTINDRIAQLESRLDSEDKEVKSNTKDLKDIKSTLNSNFNRLDNILEKLAKKLH